MDDLEKTVERDTEDEASGHETSPQDSPSTPTPSKKQQAMPTSSGSGSSTPIAPASRDQSLSRVTSKDHGRTPIDASQALPHYDWAALSNRYEDSMRECGREEAKLMTDFDKLMQSFSIWASTGRDWEEKRATKRLRTRIAYVQHAEKTVEEKRQHYLTVVQAFQNALALLNDT